MLTYKYESRDEIPKDLAEHYKEKDGAFVLELDAVIKTQEDVEALEEVVSKERKLRRDAEKKAKKLPDDFDADEYQELLELREAQEDGKTSKDEDAKIQRLETKYKAQLDEANQKVDFYKGKLFDGLKQQELEKALRENNFMDESIDLQKAYHKDSIKVIEEGDEVKVVAGPAEKSVTEYMNEYAKSEKAKPFIKAPDTSGGGNGQGDGGGGNFGSVKSKADLKDPKDKSKFVKEHGFDAFKALPQK